MVGRCRRPRIGGWAVGIDRRAVLRGSALTVAGVAAGIGASRVPRWLGPDRQPISGGYAPAADRSITGARGVARVIWHVPTDQRLVALTFDDGPGPDYTPRVLDALDAADAPATFFMVGERLAAHHRLVDGRLDRHEVGNHTWSHAELAQLDYPAAYAQLRRTHDAIGRYLGRVPTLLRPPWGHLGGSALLAADALGYEVVLWSLEMHEAKYAGNPAGQVADIARSAAPGAIVLAHDYGNTQRLVTVDHLGALVGAIRARGYTLVTVSQLLAAAAAPVPRT